MPKSEITGEVVWDKSPPEFLDFLRVYEYPYSDPAGASGKPASIPNKVIYGWQNVDFVEEDLVNSGGESYQYRLFFGLSSGDLGTDEFDVSEVNLRVYPENAADVGDLREELVEYISHPRPYFTVRREGYHLENIPSEARRGGRIPDSIKFLEVREVDDCWEFLLDEGGSTVRLDVREFDSHTLIKMVKELDSFELPEGLNGYLAASQL